MEKRIDDGWPTKAPLEEVLEEDFLKTVENFRASHPELSLGEALVKIVEEYTAI
ncbi:MAG: hypothetical protein QXL24_02160 [Candidatus Jordarchaeaceae archaeon]